VAGNAGRYKPEGSHTVFVLQERSGVALEVATCCVSKLTKSITAYTAFILLPTTCFDIIRPFSGVETYLFSQCLRGEVNITTRRIGPWSERVLLPEQNPYTVLFIILNNIILRNLSFNRSF
jgi:hypothetical protein